MRRLLPLLVAAGLVSFFLLSVFQNVEWRWLPRAFGLIEEVGPSKEDISSGKNIIPDLREGRPGFKEPKVESTSPYPIGQTKPASSNYTRSLVIARLKEENVDWIDEELGDLVTSGLLEPAVYVMDDPDAPLHPPKNKCHEVTAYLTYIIDFYDSLPDISIFMHYHRWAWHNNDLQYTDAATMVRTLSPERVTREGYMNLRCHWDPGCPSWLHPGATAEDDDKREEVVIARSWSQLFPADAIPAVLSQACCAQFAVSRERVRALPRARYAALRDWALRTELSDYLAGRVFEYVWQFIFSASPVHCPSMSVCYCDGYGICFGGPERFDAWFETRYRMEQAQEELRVWKEKAEKIDDWRERVGGGRLAEDAMLDVPEVGQDAVLKAKIDELGQKLVNDLDAAKRAGELPERRAKEAGRDWKEGDGF